MPTRTRKPRTKVGTIPPEVVARIEADRAAFQAKAKAARLSASATRRAERAAAHKARIVGRLTVPIPWPTDAPPVVARHATTGPVVDNNGFTNPAVGTVDWAKQDRITTVGTPNHQPHGPTPRGAVVSGAGKKNGGKRK